jgi:hypothetical protein
MRLPSKVNTFSDSVLALFVPILDNLKNQNMTPHDLLIATKIKTSQISIYFDALDCLYALGKIEISVDTEVLCYVETNNM